jgi:hypothetical protein
MPQLTLLARKEKKYPDPGQPYKTFYNHNLQIDPIKLKRLFQASLYGLV